MQHFLLVYDRPAGRLLREESFERRVDALQERFAVEKAHRKEDLNVEVVVVGARSREELLRTHSRYFRSLSDLAGRIAGSS